MGELVSEGIIGKDGGLASIFGDMTGENGEGWPAVILENAFFEVKVFFSGLCRKMRLSPLVCGDLALTQCVFISN